MRWLRRILQEYKLVFKISLKSSTTWDLTDKSWLADRHLKTGFYISLPIFLIPMVLFAVYRPNADLFLFLLGPAIISNLVWLGYSSWSRDKEQQGNG